MSEAWGGHDRGSRGYRLLILALFAAGAATFSQLTCLRDSRLIALFCQGGLLMGGFVAVYNYLGFRLQAPPFLIPATISSFLFLAS